MGTSMSLGSLNAQSNVLQAKEERFIQQAKSGQKIDTNAKIDKAAHDFEAILVGSWLQQAEQSFATVPGGSEDDDSGGREQMMSLGVQSLASAMATSGGLGIGKMVAAALHRREEKENLQPAATAEPNNGKASGKDGKPLG